MVTSQLPIRTAALSTPEEHEQDHQALAEWHNLPERLYRGIHNVADPIGRSYLAPVLAHTDGRFDTGKPFSIFKFADESVTSSTTLQDDNGLRFIGANITGYRIDGIIFYTADAAGDIKLDFDVAGAYGSIKWAAVGRDAADAVYAGEVGDATTGFVGGGAGATIRAIRFTAYVNAGVGGGAVKLRWAQQTSSATATIVKAGSQLLVTPVAQGETQGQSDHYHVYVEGDSNWASVEVPATDPTVQQLRRYLRGLLGIPDGGIGFRPHWRTTEWTYAGTWTTSEDKTQAYNKFPHFAIRYTADNAATATWTKPAKERVERFEVYWIDGTLSGNTMDYRIDGGDWVTVTLGRNGDNTMKHFVVDKPVGATVDFRNDQAGGRLYFPGVAFYAGWAGLVVHNVARSGTTTAKLTGGTGGADPYVLLPLLNPRFFIMPVLMADTITIGPVTPLATYRTNLDVLIDLFQTYGTVLLVAPPQQNPTGVAVNPDPDGQQEAYEAEMLDAAVAQGCAFLSMREAWGDYALANANGYMVDDFHQSQIAHDETAARIARMLRVFG